MPTKNYKDKYLAEIAEDGALTSGSLMKKVSETLISSVQDLYNKLDIEFKPVWFPILLALKQNGTMDVKTLAEKRKVSKSAISQMIKEMKEEDLVDIKLSKTDQRQKEISLTQYGHMMSHELVKPLQLMEETLEGIYGNEWKEFRKFLIRVDTEIRSKPFTVRRLQALQEVEIIKYNPKYKKDFKKINLEWIAEHFNNYEKSEEGLLNDPEQEIIAKGGEVLFATYKDQAIATLAITEKNKDTAEIVNMCVLEEFQQRDVASKLMKHAIKYAKNKGYSKVFVGLNESLKAAMKFYLKHGFKQIDFEGSKLARVNIQMSRDLTEENSA